MILLFVMRGVIRLYTGNYWNIIVHKKPYLIRKEDRDGVFLAKTNFY